MSRKNGGDAVAVITPKNPFDRRLARLEQQRVWEYVGQSVLDDIEAIKWAKACAVEASELAESSGPDGKPIPFSLKLRCKSLALDFARFVHQVNKETFQDRTIPALVRAQVEDVVRSLPAPDDEQLGPIVTDEQRQRAEVLEHLRSAMDLLRASGVERPGLVILPRRAAS